MSDTPRTDEAWDAVSRTPDGRYATDVPLRKYAFVMYGHSKQLERELAKAQNILKQCLSIMPVGHVPTHTVENLPEMIGDLAKALAEETTEREQLERELAEAREQRNTLAEALELMWPFIEEDDHPNCNTPAFSAAIAKYKAAIATVKGGSHDS